MPHLEKTKPETNSETNEEIINKQLPQNIVIKMK